MSGSSVTRDDSCIIREVDEDKFTSGILFGLNSEVLQGFRLDLCIGIRDIRTQVYIIILHRRVSSTLTISLSFPSCNLDNHNISKLLVK